MRCDRHQDQVFAAAAEAPGCEEEELSIAAGATLGSLKSVRQQASHPGRERDRLPRGARAGSHRDDGGKLEYAKAAGVYYTPTAVVGAQVRLVDEILRAELDRPLSFGDQTVVTLDPATGSGTRADNREAATPAWSSQSTSHAS